MLHLRHASPPEAGTTLVADLRAGCFHKEALRAPVLDAPDHKFGGFTLARWSFAGEEIAVRRDTGEPGPTDPVLQGMAEAAYLANPQAIPYESPRYRPWADLDSNGLVSGPEKLLPLYQRAARDFSQPLFYYRAPRLVRLGIEIAF
jgi:hypothetical protein